MGCNGFSTPCTPAQLALIIDLVGYGSANFFEGSAAAPTLSNTTAALRDGGGCTETDNNAADFTAGTPTPRNTAVLPLACPAELPPTVTATYPPNGYEGFPLDADLTVTFSEPVNTANGWFTISCDTSGSHTAAVSGGPSSFTINPDTDFTHDESCTLTILAASITDLDGIPPDTMPTDFVVNFTPQDVCLLPYTHTYAIQGSGETTAHPWSGDHPGCSGGRL